MVGWSLVQLRFLELFFGVFLSLEFAGQVSLLFSDMLGCTQFKLGGWVKLGPTSFFGVIFW